MSRPYPRSFFIHTRCWWCKIGAKYISKNSWYDKRRLSSISSIRLSLPLATTFLFIYLQIATDSSSLQVLSPRRAKQAYQHHSGQVQCAQRGASETETIDQAALDLRIHQSHKCLRDYKCLLCFWCRVLGQRVIQQCRRLYLLHWYKCIAA